MVRFGAVLFDSERGKLLVEGRPVELDRACRAVLSLLAAQPGKDVHKDRLLEAGWPGRTVEENSLTKAIGRLRRALGADAAALKTVHGYGYRLDLDNAEAGRGERRPQWSRRPGLAIAALGVAIAAAGWLWASAGETRGANGHPLIKGEPADAVGRVLWVDDHPQNNTSERRFLEQRKIAVYQVRTSEEALALLAMYDYGVVISDMNRGDTPLAGLELVREMRNRRDSTPFIVYTVVPSAAQRRLVAEAGGQRAVATSAELYDAVLPLFERGPGVAAR